MGDFISQLKENINVFVNQLTFRQKLMMILSFIFLFAIFLILFVWSSKPSYVPLYTNLSEKSAGDVIAKLQEQKVEYRISDVGNAILVPSSKVHELRITLAKKVFRKKGV